MGLARLLVLASVMLVATVVASSLPQWIRFSPRRLRQLSVYSSGLLIGAALTIVIPEGVAAVYANSSSVHHDQEHQSGHDSTYRHDAHSNPANIGLALLAGFLLMYLIDTYTHSHPTTSSVGSLHRSNSRNPHPYLTRQSSTISELEPLNAISPHHHHHHHHTREYNSDEYDWAENGGLGTASADRKLPAPTSSSSINGGPSGNPSRSSSPSHHHPPSPTNGTMPSASSSSSSASAISTVIGLVVHSLADGVSLGASSLPSGEQAAATATAAAASSVSISSSSNSLELIIFLAIMAHKGPAAFALSSLLSSNSTVTPSFLRKSLLAFSLAAPLGALLTYGLLTLVGVELEGGKAGIGWWTGLALVFSGGTFLFVATHVMKENTEGEGDHTHGVGRGDGSEEDGEEGGKGGGPVWVVAGMLTPWVLGRLVGHGHG